MAMPSFINFAPPPPQAPASPVLNASTVSLEVTQQPRSALVTVKNREKNRKPVDPPPIVRMIVDKKADPVDAWLASPYLFVLVSLLDEEGQPVESAQDVIFGQLSSSLHRLKDLDNRDGGFFVFGDISMRKTGKYRLRFNLWNLDRVNTTQNPQFCHFITRVDSDVFTVVSKGYSGLLDSSQLSRSFADQGVKLKLRKEGIKKRTRMDEVHEHQQREDAQGRPLKHLISPRPVKRTKMSIAYSMPDSAYMAPIPSPSSHLSLQPSNNLYVGIGGHDTAFSATQSYPQLDSALGLPLSGFTAHLYDGSATRSPTQNSADYTSPGYGNFPFPYPASLGNSSSIPGDLGQSSTFGDFRAYPSQSYSQQNLQNYPSSTTSNLSTYKTGIRGLGGLRTPSAVPPPQPPPTNMYNIAHDASNLAFDTNLTGHNDATTQLENLAAAWAPPPSQPPQPGGPGPPKRQDRHAPQR